MNHAVKLYFSGHRPSVCSLSLLQAVRCVSLRGQPHQFLKSSASSVATF